MLLFSSHLRGPSIHGFDGDTCRQIRLNWTGRRQTTNGMTITDRRKGWLSYFLVILSGENAHEGDSSTDETRVVYRLGCEPGSLRFLPPGQRACGEVPTS